jgi:alpha-galactosidase
MSVALGWSLAGLHLVEIAMPDGTRWSGAPATPIFSTTWADGASEDDPLPPEVETRTAPDGTHRLVARLRMGEQTTSFHLRLRDGLPVAEAWLDIEASTPRQLTEAVPLVVAIQSGQEPAVAVIEGIQGQGGGHPVGGPYRTFALSEGDLLGTAPGESGRRSTWDGTPWFALPSSSAHGTDGGLFGGLITSASWERRASWDPAAGMATVALVPTRGAPTIAPGQTWTSPVAFLGCYRGDLDEAAAIQHRFHREVLAPPLIMDFPWVQYNTWYSYVCDLQQERLLQEAEIAASLGTEIFYLDAGWWITSPSVTQDRFTTGLGIWRESRDKFPDGLVAFSDRIRALGMHFGIWVEPERVDLRRQDLASWQTDWLVRADGRYVRADWPADTDSAWICFGDPRARDWAFGWISELIETTGTRWLKWDSNYWGICNHDGHDHDPGDGESAQVAGVHEVMRRLIARFPGLVIENCAGGGTRMDFGMAAVSHATWVNDATSPGHRVRFQHAGAAYLYPPAVLNSWLIDSVFEHTAGYDQSDDVLRAMLRSRMLGAFGLSCRLVDWTDATRRIAADEIARYKATRQHLVDGRFAHLTPQPEIDTRTMGTPDDWDAYQTLSADGGTATILAFRNASAADTLTIYPKWLDPSATWRVEPERDAAYERSGADLSRNGIRIAMRPLISERILLTLLD